jgi:hypothetical protein
MLPDWKTLFAPRPLAARAMRLPLPVLAASVWFAAVGSTDLVTVSSPRFLTRAESLRAGVFKFGQPRENFTLGRLAGKLALAAADGASRPLTPAPSPGGGEGEDLALELRSFEVMNGGNGEPVVLAPVNCGFSVSLSHVNGRGVAVAFPASARIGLDLELIDPKRAETVRKGVPLSAEEKRWLKTTSLPEATALLLLWTARESLGKALGCGLACKWETLALREVRPTDAARFSGSFLHHPSFQCASWVGPDAVLSLAFERSDRDTAGVTSPP